MSITLEPATVEDAEDLARVEVRAFDADTTSVLAKLLWPRRQSVRSSSNSSAEKEVEVKEEAEERVQELTKSIREGIEKGEKIFIKAVMRDGEENRIAGFAAWLPPGSDKLEPEDVVPAVEPQEGADQSSTDTDKGKTTFQQRFGERIKETRRQHLSGEKYWYLALLTVDPDHWRKGIGRRLVQWGIDRAEQDSDQANGSSTTSTFLEASLMAEKFYQSLGFQTIGWDALDDEKAPQGVCKWPYMKRESTRIKS